jgi:two-component system phosphate regulon sensor histidine kinase PhoR
LLGLRSPQDVGQRLPNLIRHPDFIDYFTKSVYDGEVEAPSPVRANHMLSYRIVPYGNGQRLLVARDVSEVRRLEAMRRDFVSNASHELRTPLTVLKGWLEMMGAEDARGELAAWSTPLREMHSQTQRMENLVNDLLKLARLESDGQSLRNDPLPVSQLVQRVVDDAKAVSKGRHSFRVQLAPGLTLLGREVELLSVLSNLVANAVQYTPDGGEISVSLFVDAQGLHYSVRDSGIGISEDDLPRLTERFYRVDVGRSRASGGTGLGLSIVKHALERHDAALRISSVLGKGSEFHCLFPLQRVVSAADIPSK